MSHVSNTIISFSVSDAPRVEDITGYFLGIGEDMPPVWLDKTKAYGGTKALEKTIMVGAMNYMQIDKLAKFMESLEWYIPEDVQLLVADEHDEPKIFTERLNRENLKSTHRLPVWKKDDK